MSKKDAKVPFDAANAAHKQGMLLAIFTAVGLGMVLWFVLGLNAPLLFGVGVGLAVLWATYDGNPYKTRWAGNRISYVLHFEDERGTSHVRWNTHKELLAKTYWTKMCWFAASGLVTAIIVSVVRSLRM